MRASVACVAEHEDVTSHKTQGGSFDPLYFSLRATSHFRIGDFQIFEFVKIPPFATKCIKGKIDELCTWHGVEDGLQGRARIGAANNRRVRGLALHHQLLANRRVRAVGQRASVHEAPVAILQELRL